MCIEKKETQPQNMHIQCKGDVKVTVIGLAGLRSTLSQRLCSQGTDMVNSWVGF